MVQLLWKCIMNSQIAKYQMLEFCWQPKLFFQMTSLSMWKLDFCHSQTVFPFPSLPVLPLLWEINLPQLLFRIFFSLNVQHLECKALTCCTKSKTISNTPQQKLFTFKYQEKILLIYISSKEIKLNLVFNNFPQQKFLPKIANTRVFSCHWNLILLVVKYQSCKGLVNMK